MVEFLPETLSAGNQTFLLEMARGDWILTLALISGFGERVRGIDGRVIDEYTLNSIFNLRIQKISDLKRSLVSHVLKDKKCLFENHQ